VKDYDTLKSRLYEEFPVVGMPHDLIARVRTSDDGSKEDILLSLTNQKDLEEALEKSKEAQQFLQVGGKRL